jgi:hypothetical protein
MFNPLWTERVWLPKYVNIYMLYILSDYILINRLSYLTY